MSWTISIKHTRPNTDVEFYDRRREYRATENTSLAVSDQDHITSTMAVAAAFEGREELISSSTSLSENELELTKTFVYKDEPSRNAFIDDSEVQAWTSARNSYNTSNNITRVIIQNEET
jgi:hypothetical protein